MPVFGVGKVHRIWTPKGGPPQFSQLTRRGLKVNDSLWWDISNITELLSNLLARVASSISCAVTRHSVNCVIDVAKRLTAVLVLAIEPAQGSKVASGRLLLLPVTKKGLFFGPEKTRETRDANTSFPSSINLKRDGVRICLGKDVGRWSIEGFLTPSSFRYRVNYIGYLTCNIARSSGVARSSDGLVYTSGGGKFFPFSVLYASWSSAVDQLSSFRVACVADRISSRNKVQFF